MGKLYDHLSYADKLKIETMVLTKHNVAEIAEFLGVARSTIYRELKRGRYMHTLTTLEEEERYSPEISQEKYRKHLKEKGRDKKIKGDTEFKEFVEKKILEDKFSPYAVLAYIQKQGLQFHTKICLSTLYNYIRADEFQNIELTDLPYQNKRRKTKKKKKVQKRAAKGVSIEMRPKEIDGRDSVGHWEMDTVKGTKKSRKSLLVLTERKTRIQILELMKANTTREVAKALDRLERHLGEKKFREIFKTITVDNGSEFMDYEGIERSRRNKRKKRTQVYYCHPYSPSERASNENQNKLVRRYIEKGVDLDGYTRDKVLEIEKWMNDYPRELFAGKSASEVYHSEFQEEFWRGCG